MILKEYRGVLIVVFMLLALVGCGKDTKSSESKNTVISKENSLTSSESKITDSKLPAIPSPPAELRSKDKVTVYALTDGGEIYEATDFPVSGEITVGDIVNIVAQALDTQIPVIEITQQKSMVTVNLDEGMNEPESEEVRFKVLNSLAMTLYENHATDNVHYQVAGAYPEGFADDRFVPVPLKLLEGTKEEFAAIRADIPYKPSSYMVYESYNPAIYAIGKIDETAKQLSYLLMRVGLIEADAASPQELMQKQTEQLRESMILQVEAVSTFQEYENYQETAKPISASVSLKLGMGEETLYLKEHLEQAAKELFGNDFKLTHGDTGSYKYFDTEGVYTPPHRGGGYNVNPVIIDYTDNGETLTAQVAYIIQNMGGYTYKTKDGWGDYIPDTELEAFVNDKAVRYEVVVKKAADGKLTFESCKML